MQNDEIRSIINSAGSIVVSMHGRHNIAYFEQNLRSSEQISRLRLALNRIAEITGAASVKEGLYHPVTRNHTTLALLIDKGPEGDVSPQAAHVARLLFYSGNAYRYVAPAQTQPTAVLFNGAVSAEVNERALNDCQRVMFAPKHVPGSREFWPGRTLAAEITDAVVLSSFIPRSNQLFTDRAAVADTLFNKDAVKAYGVGVVMQHIATLHKGTYQHIAGQPGGPGYHVVNGYEPAKFLETTKSGPTLMPGCYDWECAIRDIDQNSYGHDTTALHAQRPANEAAQTQGVGSILDEIGITNAGTHHGLRFNRI